MYIDLLGLSGSRLQTNDTTVLLSPPSAESELRSTRYKANIVVLGKSGDQVNVAPAAENETLFTISAPGEYEARGIFFYCLGGPNGETTSILTSLTMEDIVITHLGVLNRLLTSTELELFESTDVLLLPTGGNGVLTPKQAAEVVSALEPRVVIPMHTNRADLKTRYQETTAFLKEMGSRAEMQEKARVTKKDLPQEGMNIIWLKP